MAALRWFLFSLFAFGGGAVAAFALHPPTVGIPTQSAADLRSRLAKIEQYASEGRCDAVKGQLSGAESTVRKLPETTAVTVQQELQNAIQKVRTEAVSECLRVAASKQTQSAEAQAQPTPTDVPAPTDVPTPTDSATPTPDTTAPDPGSGEGATTPSGGDSSGGGVTVPQGDLGASLRQSLDEARERYRKAREEAQRALDEFGQGFPG